MDSESFEDYLCQLPDLEYDIFMQERIARLNTEQQKIAQAREIIRKERHKLINKLGTDPYSLESEGILVAIAGMDGDVCEHGRSHAKHCLECAEIDHIMFPELFDNNGFSYQEEQDTD